jgi:hypothetical protein
MKLPKICTFSEWLKDKKPNKITNVKIAGTEILSP